jgi:hypothetical protein
LKAYPTLNRIHQRCLEHPAFQKASAENQPDSE